MCSLQKAARAVPAIRIALAIIVAPAVAQAASGSTKRAPDFTLVDQRGKSFTLSEYRGRPIVLFFGYAHCPDVCPTILTNLERARQSVAKARDSVVALVTVDPRRDTEAELGRFVGEFDPEFIGLTGTRRQLDRVYRAYHVKIQDTFDGSGDYLVAHTAFVYYIDRDGRLSGFGTWDDPQPVLVKDLVKIASSSRPR
jgi:protein SCO1/2